MIPNNLMTHVGKGVEALAVCSSAPKVSDTFVKPWRLITMRKRQKVVYKYQYGILHLPL